MLVLLLTLLSFGLSRSADSRMQAAAPAADDAPFTVGILRNDGIVIPFAVFDGKDWSEPWPTALRSVDLPIDTGNVPPKWWGKTGPIAEMTAWGDGVERGPIHILRPTVLPLMCVPRLGLVSDYRSTQTPASLLPPYPKDGLAVTGARRIGKIEIVSKESSEWAGMATALAEAFDAAEHDAIKAFTDWNDPIPRTARRKMPLELEAWYRAPMDEPGWTANYVETVKKYPPGPGDDGCGLVTSTNGWVFGGPDGKRNVKLTAHVTYCDRRDVTYMLPLGWLSVQNRSYWVFQLSGYGREGYLVARPTPKRLEVAVQYAAGFCPRP
jgi:hypothetical protein